MKKVYVEHLPRKKSNIDWKKSVGGLVKFTYDDIQGEVEIIGYEEHSKGCLTIRRKNDVCEIKTNNFLRCKIGKILKVKTNEYLYNIGDIVNGLKIIEQTRLSEGRNGKKAKGYKVECIIDKQISYKSESVLKRGIGCGVCSNKIIVKGINDIATTHPHLIKYFVHIEDVYTHSYSSGKKALIKCPECSFEKEIRISSLTTQGFGCPRCSDGKSYPEKFIFNLLEQLSVDFEIEYSPIWANIKRYDFYVPELNCIIEAHGEQHYRDNKRNKERTLKEEKENDELKKELAINNGINKYVVLDCRKSNIEYIKNSILSSELNILFDLSKIDWLQCHEFACNNKVKEACDLWNSGIKSTVKIGDILGVSRGTVINYLKRGKALKWCDYNSKEVMSKYVVKKDNGKKCRVIINNIEYTYKSKAECLRSIGISDLIFYKLINSKKPFIPHYKVHSHLRGMMIEYIK